jgi:hypothetical protein
LLSITDINSKRDKSLSFRSVERGGLASCRTSARDGEPGALRQVQAKLATNQSSARRNNTAHRYLLRALVSCGSCGLACTARAIDGRDFYCACNARKRYAHSHRTTRCPARHTPADQLDALVWQDLCALLAEPESFVAAVARAHDGAQAISLRETPRLPQELLARCKIRCDATRQQHLAGLAASVEAFRARVQGGLADANFEQRRQLVLLLVERVVVTEAEVEIRYVLPTGPKNEHVCSWHCGKTISRRQSVFTCSPSLNHSSCRPVQPAAEAAPVAAVHASKAGKRPIRLDGPRDQWRVQR